MNLKDVKFGAILSYLLIIINTLYGLFFTPYLITCLGDGEYGVYKIMASLVGSLAVLDLGIGSTVLRYTAKYNAENNKKDLENFIAMSLIEALILSGIMAILSTVVYFKIENLYGTTLTFAELKIAKDLFVLFSCILILNTFEKVFFSAIAGCGCFTFSNSLKVARILLKVIISVLIISRFADSRLLLVIDLSLLIMCMLMQMSYIRYTLKIKIHLYNWDKRLFLGTFKYTILMFIQTIVAQFNGNLDNLVIGAVVGATAVAVYSIGLQLYNMYEQFAVALSDLMLPVVSKRIAEGASIIELENLVIKIGRLEFIALGGALCGFFVIGKEFILLWLGENYLFAWTVAIILMIPTTIPLIQNVCLSILRAKNRMLFRTIVVSVMAVFNLAVTIIGVSLYGPICACIGTAVGLIGANIIAMNIYYIKIVKLNVFRIFSNVLKRTWLCCLVSGTILFGIHIYINGSWIAWIFKVVAFIIVYAIMLINYGFNENERATVKNLFMKIYKMRK